MKSSVPLYQSHLSYIHSPWFFRVQKDDVTTTPTSPHTTPASPSWFSFQSSACQKCFRMSSLPFIQKIHSVNIGFTSFICDRSCCDFYTRTCIPSTPQDHHSNTNLNTSNSPENDFYQGVFINNESKANKDSDNKDSNNKDDETNDMHHDASERCNDDDDSTNPKNNSNHKNDVSPFNMQLLQERIKILQRDIFQQDRALAHNWSVGNFDSAMILILENDYVRKLAFHGNLLALGSYTGKVHIHQIPEDVCPTNQDDPSTRRGSSSSLTSGPKQYVEMPFTSSSPSFGALDRSRLIPVTTQDTRLITFAGHGSEVTCIDFDGRYVISGSSDKNVLLMDFKTKVEKRILSFQDMVTAVQIRNDNSVFLKDIQAADQSVPHRLPLKKKVYAAALDGKIKVFCLETAQVIQTYDTGEGILSLDVSDNYILAGCRSGKVVVFSPKYSTRLLEFMAHERGNVTCLKYDTLSERIVTGSADNSLKVWCLKSSQCLFTLNGHDGPVVSVQFDDAKIISAARDGTIRSWNTKNGKMNYLIQGYTMYIGSLQYDRRFLISDGTNNVIICRDFLSPSLKK